VLVHYPVNRHQSDSHGGLPVPQELSGRDHSHADSVLVPIRNFIFFPILGFSVNTPSLLGLVIAVGEFEISFGLSKILSKVMMGYNE
jgi:hypothetical protein